MKGITFGNLHTYDDLQLILTTKEIGAPTVKSKKIDIEGADGVPLHPHDCWTCPLCSVQARQYMAAKIFRSFSDKYAKEGTKDDGYYHCCGNFSDWHAGRQLLRQQQDNRPAVLPLGAAGAQGGEAQLRRRADVPVGEQCADRVQPD